MSAFDRFSKNAPTFTDLVDPLLDLLYPRACTICGSRVKRHAFGPACGSCWSEFDLCSTDDPMCAKCGASAVNDLQARENTDCRECRDHHYDHAASVGPHAGALRAVVLELKVFPAISSRAARAIGSRLDRSNASGHDVIVPVPLAKQREFERGFNQAAVIAKVVGRVLRLPVDARSLAREKFTPINRAGMDRKARAATVLKAFKVERPNLIEGKRILLVDDVFTTGSTVSACAHALKSRGAARVDVFTITRAAVPGK